MPAESTTPGAFGYEINEYVWDRTWEGPAVIVGTQGDRLTVAEIVMPDRKLGRVAQRLPTEICRYVRLLVPEDEANLVQGAIDVITQKSVGVLRDTLDSFSVRLRSARKIRGLVE